MRAAYPIFFKGVITLDLGIGLLALCVIASVLYLLDRLSAENRNLTKRIKFQQASMAKMRELMKTSYEEKKSFEEYFTARKELVQKIADLLLQLLIGLFHPLLLLGKLLGALNELVGDLRKHRFQALHLLGV